MDELKGSGAESARRLADEPDPGDRRTDVSVDNIEATWPPWVVHNRPQCIFVQERARPRGHRLIPSQENSSART